LLFAKIMLGDNPLQQLGASFVLSWLGIFIVGMLPQILSGLAVSGLERTVAGRLEAQAMRGAPQVGKAVLAGSARGLATGAAVAGRAGYAQAMRVKPIADVMRAGGVMVGRARATLSQAVSGLQRGLEGRLARDETKFSGTKARLDALTRLKKGFQEYGDLKQRTEDARLRLADALQYYQHGLGPEEQGEPENMAGLALARMEYDTLEEARAEREPQLKEALRETLEEYEESNLIARTEYRQLKTGLEAPQLAIKALDKMIEEQENEVRARKAELERDQAIHKPLANMMGAFRRAPARLKKIINDALTVPRKIGKEGERARGVEEVIKVKESA
jgi:chromosome segregation ATPase